MCSGTLIKGLDHRRGRHEDASWCEMVKHRRSGEQAGLVATNETRANTLRESGVSPVYALAKVGGAGVGVWMCPAWARDLCEAYSWRDVPDGEKDLTKAQLKRALRVGQGDESIRSTLIVTLRLGGPDAFRQFVTEEEARQRRNTQPSLFGDAS